MTLRDGRVFEDRQPHIRGGVQEPLTREEIERKFRSNARYGGWDAGRAERFLQFAKGAFEAPVDLTEFRGWIKTIGRAAGTGALRQSGVPGPSPRGGRRVGVGEA